MVRISQAFLDHLSELRFLIADTTAGRKTFRHLLTEMKIKTTKITVTSNLQETLEDLEKNKPHIIFADYSLEPGFMPKLLEIQKEFLSGEDVQVFFLAASKEECSTLNISREEGFDAVFIKPFSYGHVLETFINILQEKFDPSPYTIEILAGKFLFSRGEYAQALSSFNNAEMINREHPRAKTLQGRTLMKLNRIDEAMAQFKAALKIDQSNYDALVGFLEILNIKGDYVQAYQLSKRLTSDHTLPLTMLRDLVRLSIQNKKFEDVFEYHKLLEVIRNPDPEIALNVATAFIMSGIHYISVNKLQTALDALRKAETLAPNNISIRTKIFTALSQGKLFNEIELLLQRLPKDVANSTEFRLARFDHIERYSDPLDIISEGIHLLRSGIRHPIVHRVVIERSIQARRPANIIHELIHNAIADCPDEKENFQSFIPKIDPKS